MNVQPIEHGSDTAAQQQLMPTKASNSAQKIQTPRAEAVRIAKAKISRRKSLGKQREAQKTAGARVHPGEQR